MEINEQSGLRSLLAEATRQQHYFEKRGIPEVSSMWQQIATHAFAAMQSSNRLALVLISCTELKTINKACGYCEQLNKHHSHNAL